MAIAIDTGRWGAGFDGDSDALLRLQNILLQAAEGARDGELNAEYQQLRRALLDNAEYGDLFPKMVRTNRDLDSVWADMKSLADKWEPRRAEVRKFMAPLLDRAEELEARQAVADSDPPSLGTATDASAWTGTPSNSQRLAVARDLLPIARASIERLIQELSTPGHNGGPILDDHQDAIENLRKLHAALGEILDACEGGRWDEVLSQGLPADAARYARRAARLLRDDPMPYAVSAMLLGILYAVGIPDIGGYLAGVTLTVQKGRSR